jgi:hypothetical protein
MRFCGPFPGCFLPFSAQIPIRIPDFPTGKPGLVDPDFRPGGIPLVLVYEVSSKYTSDKHITFSRLA